MGSLNSGPTPSPPESPPDERLDSWKEIATYLKRDVRTLHRWEVEEGLPVHRHLHKKRGSVYAYRSELEVWWNNRRLNIDKQEKAAARTGHWRSVALAGALVVVILAAAVYFVRQRAGGHAKVPERRVMLAVLPFENVGGDPDQEYFSDGLTEELIARLGSLDPKQLAVIARSSAMRYKHSGRGVAQIGRELGVDYLLQGTVRREGSAVRVTAELVQVRDQTHLWSHGYQRERRDLSALQADLAQAVAAEIQVKLTSAWQAGLARSHPANPEAHEAYLKGLYFWNKLTEQALREAIAYFEQAIQLDPGYAEAYARLGSCYGMLGNFGALPPSEAGPRNKAAAMRALEIDDTDSEAHTQLAFPAMFYDHDWRRAEVEFRRAIELNPNNANAHRGMAQYLLSNGRFEDSLAEIERARELDPVSLGINSDRGWFLHFARRPDDAIAQLRKTLELDRNFAVAHAMLGNAYELHGDYDLAIAEYQEAVNLSGASPSRIAMLGHAYAMGGRKKDARQAVKQLEQLSKQGYVTPYGIATIYAALGEQDRALTWLEKAYDEHYWMLAFLKVDPKMDPLRSDPRFQDLQRRVGLAD